MLSSKGNALLHLSKILCNSTRNARGGVSIPVKKVNPLIPKKIKESYSEREFKKLRRDNKGAAHSIRRRIDCGYENDPDMDPEDFINPDMDAFDSDTIFHKYRKLAEADSRTKHFFNVKRKHFKEEKLPNMLTYIEKQQIRQLHKEDPETWHVDKLAQSFPASPSIISKVLKSKFTAYTIKNVQKHDKAVHRNWDLFKKGKLSLDKELEDHYTKFVGRLNLETNVEEIKKFLPPPPDFNNLKYTEFGNIVASSKKYKLQREQERKQVEYDDNGHIILSSKNIAVKSIRENSRSSNKVSYTLDEFRQELDCRADKTESGKLIISQNPNKALPSSNQIPKKALPNSNQTPKKALQNSTIDEKESSLYKHYGHLNSETGVIDQKVPINFFDPKEDSYPLKINIPSKLWQRNKVYRIKDCFYDDEGVFLYRVPGLF